MTNRIGQFRGIATLAVIVWVSMASVAFADSVRVTRDRATVWRADSPGIPLSVVAAGTILEIAGRQGVWLRVTLPESLGDPTVVGLILEANVEPVTGPAKPGDRRAIPPPGPQGRQGRQGRGGVQVPPRAGPSVSLRGFGEVGYLRLAARESFNAIFEKDATWLPGGGAQLVWRNGLFVGGEVEWFKLTGQRVFVLGNEVFRLGIEDVVRAIPISATLGYQLGRFAVARPYMGGGAGLYLFRERSEFAEGGENVSKQFSSYHVVAGVEVLRRRRFSTAIEAQYTAVRDAIGEGGVSAGFSESDLGGLTIRMKILVR